MKHLKVYEKFPYISKLDRIFLNGIEFGDNLTVNVYKLAFDFYDNIEDKKNINNLDKAEKDYMDLIKKLFLNNVIEFTTYNSKEKVMGICKEIKFDIDEYDRHDECYFELNFIFLKLENDDVYIIDDSGLVTIYDIDPDIYRNGEKYNL